MIDPEHYDCNISAAEAERIDRERERKRIEQRIRNEERTANQIEAQHFPPGARDAFNSRFRSE